MKSQLKLSKERVLVTGASGFLGSHLCRSLCVDGAEVHAISRNWRSGDKRGLHWWQGDLSDFTTAQKLLTEIKPDVIFHLTSHGWGGPGLEHVLSTLHSDLIATVNVLTAVTELKIRRLVLTASLEEPQSNDPEITPSSPYGAAKWASGAYARMFHLLYQTPLVLVRIFMTYGPGQAVGKLIPYVTLSLLKNQVPKLSTGERLIDWLYVDDVIRGLLAAAEASDVEGRTIDLGSGTLVSIRDIVLRLVELVKTPVQPLFGALPPRPLEPVRAANTNDAYARLGWKPVTPLEKGLELTVNWYRAQLKREVLQVAVE